MIWPWCFALVMIWPSWETDSIEDRNTLTSFLKIALKFFHKNRFWYSFLIVVLLQFPDCHFREHCLFDNENKRPEEVNAVLKVFARKWQTWTGLSLIVLSLIKIVGQKVHNCLVLKHNYLIRDDNCLITGYNCMIRMSGKLYFRPMPDNELFNGTYSVQEQFDFKN